MHNLLLIACSHGVVNKLVTIRQLLLCSACALPSVDSKCVAEKRQVRYQEAGQWEQHFFRRVEVLRATYLRPGASRPSRGVGLGESDSDTMVPVLYDSRFYSS